jgi:NlpC/P60 family putative phage cell wall peptidase
MTADAVLAEARSWLGTPFHHAAMVKGKRGGVDCAHFLIGVYSAVGRIEAFEPERYPPDWHFHRDAERFLGSVQRYAERVEAGAPADVAMFRFGRCASHAAIVLDWPLVIHAYFRQGVVITDATGAELAGRLHSFWRLKEDPR